MKDTITVKCPDCGGWYKHYAYYVGDQSVCPKCRLKVEDMEDYEIRISDTAGGEE